MYITNPALPYCCPIGTTLTPGTLIRISGTVSPYATTFAINLQCGGNVNPRDDVALHLSPVFTPPPRIVRNSISSNRWGPEESFGGFPLAAGSSFEFMILVEHSEFRIALNGAHFTEFRHRLPYDRITHIALDGDATINTLSVEGSPYAAASAPPMEQQHMSGGAPPPYPPGGPIGMPPAPGLYPPLGGMGSSPYPPAGAAPYPPPSASHQPYVPQSVGGGGMPYPGGPTAYPAAPGYPGQAPAGGAYPGYVPGSAPPPPGYPQGQQQGGSSGIGGKIGAALGGLGLGAAATSIGSSLFGNKHGGHGGHGGGGIMGGIPGLGGGHSGGHKSSKPIPIGTIAAGAGAAALGAAVLTGHHPFKKAKKIFKHKHKFGKFKHKGWGHRGGWGSSSSSSSEEEE